MTGVKRTTKTTFESPTPASMPLCSAAIVSPATPLCHTVRDLSTTCLETTLPSDALRTTSPPLTMTKAEPFHVTPGLRHRMIAIEDTDVLEVSTPEIEDVVRLEDRYGR